MMLPGDEAFLASVKSARISSFHNSPVCSLDEIDLCAVNIYTVSTQDLSWVCMMVVISLQSQLSFSLLR